MPIGVLLKSSNTGYAGRMRRAAMRTKCSRVIVASSKETLVVMSRKHSGRWLDDFARNERATIITRNAEIPTDTATAACGLEMFTTTSRKKHQNQCRRCESILTPRDIRAEVQAEVSEVAMAGNTQNLYQPVTSSRAEEPAPEETAPVEALVAESTLPVLIEEMRGIADRALNLAGEVETAVAALNRLSEIRLEMHGLVEEYERLKEEAARIK
jgi:hypothetical protein